MPVSAVLLEREEELATIERVLEAAASGDGGPLTIEGAAGAGKTPLLDAAAGLGEAKGMTVLRARGGEFEREFAYGVVRQLFEPLLGDPGRRQTLLGGETASAAPVFEPTAAPAQGADPFGVQHGLHKLVARIAEEAPTLLLVDDAQWSDLASLRALVYAGRRLAGLAAALALAVRTGEPGEHEPLLDELRREPGAPMVEPGPLSAGAAAELAAREAGRRPSEDFAAGCCEATAGNPFLLVELLHGIESGMAEDGECGAERLAELAAAGASRSILTRLARLGERSTAVARAVAVLEPNAEARLVAALTGLPAEEVAAESEGLVAARLLTDSRPVAFVHPLVREAVLSEVPAPRRAADHARAARLLDEDGASIDTVAAQLLLAEPAADPWAVAELREATVAALGRGAPEAAVSYLRRALREPPPKAERLEVSRELGVALLRADEPEGIEVLRAVRSALDDPLARAEIAAELSVSLAFRRPGGEGVALLEESLAEVEDQETEIGLSLRAHLVGQAMTGLDYLPTAIRAEPGELPDGDSLAGRMLLRGLGYLEALGHGSIESAVELIERAGLDHATLDADAFAGQPSPNGLAGLALADRSDLSEELFEVTISASKRRGTTVGLAASYGFRGFCRFGEGRLRDARADAELGLRLVRQVQMRVALGAWLSVALKTLVASGELDVAQALLDDVWQGREPGPGIPGAILLIARGELRQAGGRHAEARHDYLAAAERVRWLPYANPEVLGWRTGLATAEAALGNEEEARRLAAEALALAREAGGERGIGITLRIQGAVTGGSEGIELLREASEILADPRARLQHAHALADLGAALRRANRRKEAREPLRKALDLAHRCGAAPLEERARTDLEATGARPRKAVLSGVDSLTPSELRVAQMAADGMTNPEIAQSLVVSRKTVETHMRHVFQKLDVNRRTELAGRLAGA